MALTRTFYNPATERFVAKTKLTAAALNHQQDLLQAAFEARMAPFTGLLALPTSLAIDSAHDKVDAVGLTLLITGIHLTGSLSWAFTTQASDAYVLQVTTDGEALIRPASTPNSDAYTVASVTWNLSTTTLSALVRVAEIIVFGPTSTDDLPEGETNLYHTEARVNALIDAALAELPADVASFTDLDDVPSAYTGQGGKLVAVKADVSGLEFINAPATYTDEQAQDAVGTILADSDTVDFTYTDGTPSISAAVKTQQSITADSSGLKLSGDSTTPGNNTYYGTDASGTKGFFALPEGGSTPEVIYLNPVLGILSTPPAEPTAGDRYIVGTVPTGAWEEYYGYVVEWSGSTWLLTPGIPGALTYHRGESAWYGTTDGYVWTDIAGSGSYTDEQAQDAVGGILADDGDIDFTYDDTTPKITAAIKNSTLTPAMLDVLDSPSEGDVLAYNATNGFEWVTPSTSGGGVSYSVSTKTADYTVLTSDLGVGTTLVLNSAGGHTFTLPELSAGDLGKPLTCVKAGAGTLLVTAPTGVTITGSGAGGSLFNDLASETWATVTLLPITTTQWVITGSHGTWTYTE
jgi:hypothetical protein